TPEAQGRGDPRPPRRRSLPAADHAHPRPRRRQRDRRRLPGPQAPLGPGPRQRRAAPLPQGAGRTGAGTRRQPPVHQRPPGLAAGGPGRGLARRGPGAVRRQQQPPAHDPPGQYPPPDPGGLPRPAGRRGHRGPAGALCQHWHLPRRTHRRRAAAGVRPGLGQRPGRGGATVRRAARPGPRRAGPGRLQRPGRQGLPSAGIPAGPGGTGGPRRRPRAPAPGGGQPRAPRAPRHPRGRRWGRHRQLVGWQALRPHPPRRPLLRQRRDSPPPGHQTVAPARRHWQAGANPGPPAGRPVDYPQARRAAALRHLLGAADGERRGDRRLPRPPGGRHGSGTGRALGTRHRPRPPAAAGGGRPRRLLLRTVGKTGAGDNRRALTGNPATMKIIIVGAGQVGGTLAEHLASEANDITVVDVDGNRLRELQDRLDIRTVEGMGCHPDVLMRASIEDADMLVAVTSSDEINMLACQVAYSLFRTPTKIARVRAQSYVLPRYRDKLFSADHLPVDVLITPEQVVTDYIHRLVEQPGSLQVLDFADGIMQLVAVRAYSDGPLVGNQLRPLREHMPNVDCRVAAIFRRDRSIVPEGDTVIEAGDEVFFIAAKKNIRAVMGELRQLENPYRRLIIAGGGNIGYRLAQIGRASCRE